MYYGTSVTSVSKWTAPHCTKPRRCWGTNTIARKCRFSAALHSWPSEVTLISHKVYIYCLLSSWCIHTDPLKSPQCPTKCRVTVCYTADIYTCILTHWSHLSVPQSLLHSRHIYVLTHWSHLSVPQSIDLLSVKWLMYTYWPIEVTYIYWGNLNGPQSTDLLSVIQLMYTYSLLTHWGNLYIYWSNLSGPQSTDLLSIIQL